MNEKRGKSSLQRSSAKLPGGSGSPMDVDLLESLVKLMAANDLNTIELREGDRRVTLKRGPAGVSYAPSAPPAPAPATAPQPGAPVSAAAAANDESQYLRITSPMPGTFYTSPKQGEKPFVTVGSLVDEQTDVCIIEAMKVFNNLPAGVSGTIARVCMNDGQPVEFGTLLFLVKPK